MTRAGTAGGPGDWALDDVMDVLGEMPEDRAPQVGFIGYGETKSGDRILLAADSLYDAAVVDAVAGALRRKGATVDILITDVGKERAGVAVRRSGRPSST